MKNTGPIDRNGMKTTDTDQFFTRRFLVLLVNNPRLDFYAQGKSLIHDRVTDAINTALSPALSISDVMNNAEMCGKSIKYVTSSRFMLFTGKHRTILGSSNSREREKEGGGGGKGGGASFV